MSSATENIATIKGIYEAFGRGDVEHIVAGVTDDVDWGAEAAGSGAPWYGRRRGKDGVSEFFEDFGKSMTPEEFVPLVIVGSGDDVLSVVQFRVRSNETGRTASMQLHHHFRFRDGKIAYYRGTEDTAQTLATLAP